MLRLLVTHGHEEQVFPVPDGEARLGSASENDIVLDIKGVSREHALVRRVPGGIEVLDLKSKNGLYVGGERMERATLTPGLRVQIGKAWLELEELSSAEALLARFFTDPVPRIAPSSTTSTTSPEVDSADITSPEAAACFLYHLDLTGVGLPGQRPEILARAREHLGAESLVSVERRRRRLVLRERVGLVISDEEEVLSILSGVPWPFADTEVRLRRAGVFLLAGRDEWFLGARFASEALARMPWRRDVLRLLAARFFAPARVPKRFSLQEVLRVLALTGNNISETARRLGVTRPTIHRILERSGRRTRNQERNSK